MPGANLTFFGASLSTKSANGNPVGNTQLWMYGDNLANNKFVKVFVEDPQMHGEAHAFWRGKMKVKGGSAVVKLKYEPNGGDGPGKKKGLAEGDLLTIFVTVHENESGPAECIFEGEVILDGAEP